MSMITYRYYQSESLEAIREHIKLPGNDIVVLPTGAGKSIVIAATASELNEDVLILQPKAEILKQNRNKLAIYVNPNEIATYSASFKEKDIKKYTFAMIGSIKDPSLFKHFKIVFIDECHDLNQKRQCSMLISFLKEIGNPKVIGFTATPYRNINSYHKTDQKDVFEVKLTLKLINRMKPNKNSPSFWSRIIYNVNVADLIAQGFLSPIKYMDASEIPHAQLPLNKTKSDFDLALYDRLTAGKKERVIKGITWAESEHKSVLVFCSTIENAENLSQLIPNSAIVTGKTPTKERDRILDDFKNHTIKTVFNVGVLTTGFDHPGLDCIVLNRPTRSLSLYYQMIGRGLRIAEGKTHCTVIDFTGTVRGMGRIETIKLVKRYLWEIETEAGSWNGRALHSHIVEKE